MSEILVIPTITGEISATQSLTGELTAEGRLQGTVSQDIVHNTYYEGSYEITPKVEGQTMATADKVMRTDVDIKPVPYSEVRNEAGGLTVVIAFEE